MWKEGSKSEICYNSPNWNV